MMLCRVGVGGFWPSHLAMCEHETTAGTRIGVPILFQLISVASLARMGHQSPCRLLCWYDLKGTIQTNVLPVWRCTEGRIQTHVQHE